MPTANANQSCPGERVLLRKHLSKLAESGLPCLPSESAEYCDLRCMLLSTLPESFESYDIALANLLMASGLPGSESLDIRRSLGTIDEWARVVSIETERLHCNFRPNP